MIVPSRSPTHRMRLLGRNLAQVRWLWLVNTTVRFPSHASATSSHVWSNATSAWAFGGNGNSAPNVAAAAPEAQSQNQTSCPAVLVTATHAPPSPATSAHSSILLEWVLLATSSPVSRRHTAATRPPQLSAQLPHSAKQVTGSRCPPCNRILPHTHTSHAFFSWLPIKMKFDILSRSETEHTRARRDDALKIQRNLAPELHPFQQEREYSRALKAAKLARHFAKPFVGALEGHTDGVYSIATNPHSLASLVTGACDGEIRVWDLASKKLNWKVAGAHAHGFVRGLAVTALGEQFVSCGDDKQAKLWDFASKSVVETFVWETPLLGVDAHAKKANTFATCGEEVLLWDAERPSEPIHQFNTRDWADSTSMCQVKFNRAEHDIMATVGKSDRSTVLYDCRQQLAIKKMTHPMRNNALSWNPMEPFFFTTACEDFALYTFDMRLLDRSLIIHRDHVSAVLDVSYSPTGKEFVSASYDRSVRIFSVKPGWESKGRSREVYTAPRMHRVFAARYSPDSNYVFSGSEDGNVRIWKSVASKSLAVLGPKQKLALQSNDALLDKFKHLTEVRKIHNKRILPKQLYKETKNQRAMRETERRKKLRVDAHAQHTGEDGGDKPATARQKAVLRTSD